MSLLSKFEGKLLEKIICGKRSISTLLPHWNAIGKREKGLHRHYPKPKEGASAAILRIPLRTTLLLLPPLPLLVMRCSNSRCCRGFQSELVYAAHLQVYTAPHPRCTLTYFTIWDDTLMSSGITIDWIFSGGTRYNVGIINCCPNTVVNVGLRNVTLNLEQIVRLRVRKMWVPN